MADFEKCADEDITAENARTASQSQHSTAAISELTTVERESPGARAYLTVIGTFLVLFCSFGQIVSFGTFQSWYADHQLYRSPSSISWIGSLQLWTFFFSGGVVGRVFDSYGPRIVMLLGAVLHVFSLVMTSISTQYYQYVLCQGILFGVSTGMLFYPSLASVTTHFCKYRATAVGIALSGSSVGGIVYPIVLRRLFPTIGFAWTVRVLALVGLGCCSCAIALVSRRTAPRVHRSMWVDTKMFRDGAFMFLVAGSFLVCFGIFIPFFYIVSYAQANSMSAPTSFYLLSVMNAGGVAGRIAPAYLSDVVGRFNLLIPSAFLAGLSCLVLWTSVTGPAGVMAFACAYGFFSGAFIAGINPCVVQLAEKAEDADVGTRIGVLYTFVSLPYCAFLAPKPSLFGGPAAGALLTRGHGYMGMILLSGVTVVVGSFLILWSRLKSNSRLWAKE